MSAISAFYRGEAPDTSGRFLRDLWTWNDDQLEETHDFIQWMFPLPEPSAYNPRAPLLTPDNIAEFRRDRALQANLLRSAVCIFRFFGLALSEEGVVQPGTNFAARVPDVWSAPNHNWLRMTRVLRSLSLLGLENVALAFYRQLQLLYRAQRFPIPSKTYEFWTEAVRGIEAGDSSAETQGGPA